MKKYFVLVLVLTLLAAAVVPAMAAGGPPPGKGTGRSGKMPFAFSGTIEMADPDAGTVTITVVCGNILAKPYFDEALTIQTGDETRFLLRNPGGTATPVEFDYLEAGQKVSVHGQITDGVWTASRITVGAELTCLP